jgi:hypothetical protein
MTNTRGVSIAQPGADSTLAVTADMRELRACEAVIERGLKMFIAVGTALAEIRDKRLYREQHGTFEEYCRERWGLQRTRAYELMSAAETVHGLSEISRHLPDNEGQAKALRGLSPQQAADILREAHQRTNGRVTARAIDDVRRELQPRSPREVLATIDRSRTRTQYGPYTAHPLLLHFPMMSDDELLSLAESIRRMGLIMPLTISREDPTVLLDGRQRYIACQVAGVEPRYETDPDNYRGDDIDSILSANVIRQHLSTDQRAMMAVELEELWSAHD